MTARCPKCGRDLEPDVVPRPGQNVVCPYCDAKFPYGSRPTRIPLPFERTQTQRGNAPADAKGAHRAASRVSPSRVSLGECVTIPQAAAAQTKTRGRLSVGDLLLDRYEVVAELGQGGMGIVYKCFDRTGGIEVAVKGLPPEVSHDAASMEDIRDNFRLVSDLRHPGICGIRNLEADPKTGDYYLVMDVASGQNLRRWARSHQGPESFRAKLQIISEIAAALDYAHGKQIMHRDIKPENVMVDAEGHACVLDFGLASRIRSSMSRVSLVMRAQSGTPDYKAPEQWRGQPQDAATDQYALGVLAYELLSGYLPFDSEDLTILRMSVLSEPVAEIPDMPAPVNAALVRAMAKNRQDRFASCGDFARALAGVDAPRAGASKTAAVAAAHSSAGSSGNGGRAWIVALAVGLAVFVSLAVLVAFVTFRGVFSGAGRPADKEPSAASNPVEQALEAFRRNDYQAGYQYAMSTDRKHPKLQCYLGMCYDQQEPSSKRLSITKDDWTAKEWYEKAAEQGDARAMMKLGLFYENGRACNGRDLRKAADWFKKAAAKGDYPEGKANLQRFMEKLRKEKELADKERQDKEDRQRRADERKREEIRLETMRQHGYVIESGPGGRKAVWREGNTLPQHPHWVTTAKEKTWRVEDGYARIDPNGKVFSPVVWKPGWTKPSAPDVKAGETEGTWLHRVACPTCRGSKSARVSVTCPECGGSRQSSQTLVCASCGGKGTRQVHYRCGVCNGSRQSVSSCAACGGRGRSTCGNCNGSGRVVNPAAVIGDIGNLIGGIAGGRRRGGGGFRPVPTGPQYIACPSCRGSGVLACSSCGGNGQVRSTCSACSGYGQTIQSERCGTCGGTGKTSRKITCPKCAGGQVFHTQTCMYCKGEGTVWR